LPPTQSARWWPCVDCRSAFSILQAGTSRRGIKTVSCCRLNACAAPSTRRRSEVALS
jgi:hypothetical protein